MFSGSYYGKRKRFNRLFINGRTLIVPIDDSLIFGPIDGLENLSNTISSIVNSKPSGVLGYKGSYSLLSDISYGSQIPFIFNLSASTTTGKHTQKIKICTVKEALAMGADCVAVHINFTSEYENEMIYNLAEIVSEADQMGVPVLAIAYPRKEKNDNEDENYEVEKETDINLYTNRVCKCVRTSVELGADIIKTQYTGSIQSFQKVINSALGRPVIIAGGPLISIRKSYQLAKDAIEAGAAGISFGRNVFNSKNIEAYLAGLKEIVFCDASVEDAIEIYNGVDINE